MKKVIIFGLSQFAEILSYYIALEKEYEVAAYTVHAEYVHGGGTNAFEVERPIVAFEEIEYKYPPDEYSLFICVGYNRMNTIRERVFLEAKKKGYEVLSYIHPTATVLTNDFAEGTIVMERALIGPFVKIGKGNIFWPDSHIAHHTSIGNFNFFTISASIAGNIVVGNNCFFGNNCTIKDGIRIQDYTLIGAGCYVSCDTKTYGVYVPARSVCLQGKSSLEMNLLSG